MDTIHNIEDYRAGRRTVSKMSTEIHEVSNMIDIYEESESKWSTSFKCGYLDGICLKLQHLIDEARADEMFFRN